MSWFQGGYSLVVEASDYRPHPHLREGDGVRAIVEAVDMEALPHGGCLPMVNSAAIIVSHRILCYIPL